jgi:homoserine dehydrogenase
MCFYSAEGTEGRPTSYSELRLAAAVSPREIATDDPLANLRGENNLLRLVLKTGEEITITGKGAGRWPTTESVFADLMDIYRYRANQDGPNLKLANAQ